MTAVIFALLGVLFGSTALLHLLVGKNTSRIDELEKLTWKEHVKVVRRVEALEEKLSKGTHEKENQED